jgi:hypothetical protein
MPDSAAYTDFASQLPADTYHQLIRTLRQTLPPPLGDSTDDLARRDHAAIARIAALTPANAAEADLAALYVAASEQWKDCLRLAQQPDISACWAMKCRAQANSMMRQAQSGLRLLLRMQVARQKTEADSAARERAAWTEHAAIGLMAQALPASPQPGTMTENPPPEPNAAGECASIDQQNAALLRCLEGTAIAFGRGHPSRPAGEAATRSAADEGTTLGPEFMSRPVILTPPSPHASAGGDRERAGLAAMRDRPLLQWLPATIVCVPPGDETAAARVAFRPPDGAVLHGRFAEAPARLAYSETRQG